ncbi:unnamed protein product [Cuscuta campestris]|uniref:Mitochondrial import inner membrane translocase subunit n=1 Tax=Cuscuta campestris TaxID=132261 RepID=A0A484NA98_9ASTE|nr:unnamed protein product [Cuscuta campestris]
MPSSGSPPNVSSDDLVNELKTTVAEFHFQRFFETVRDKCFEKCITKPGSSLSGSESSCVSRCVERYSEATSIIGQTLLNQRH